MGRHLREDSRIDDVAGFRAAWNMQRDDIALGDHLGQRRHIAGIEALHYVLRAGTPRIIDDVHAKAETGAFGHRLGNAAETDQPQRLAAQAGAKQMGRPPACPLPGAQFPLAFARAPGGHQHQGDGDIGGRIRQDARRIGHYDACAARRRHIDMIDACAVIGDDLRALPRRPDNAGVQLVGDGGADGVIVLHRRSQCRFRQRDVILIERRIIAFRDQRLDPFGPFARHQ